jgi:hypothetical protein
VFLKFKLSLQKAIEDGSYEVLTIRKGWLLNKQSNLKESNF